MMSHWRREKLTPGIYDEPISQQLHRELVAVAEQFVVHRHSATARTLLSNRCCQRTSSTTTSTYEAPRSCRNR